MNETLQLLQRRISRLEVSLGAVPEDIRRQLEADRLLWKIHTHEGSPPADDIIPLANALQDFLWDNSKIYKMVGLQFGGVDSITDKDYCKYYSVGGYMITFTFNVQDKLNTISIQSAPSKEDRCELDLSQYPDLYIEKNNSQLLGTFTLPPKIHTLATLGVRTQLDNERMTWQIQLVQNNIITDIPQNEKEMLKTLQNFLWCRTNYTNMDNYDYVAENNRYYYIADISHRVFLKNLTERTKITPPIEISMMLDGCGVLIQTVIRFVFNDKDLAWRIQKSSTHDRLHITLWEHHARVGEFVNYFKFPDHFLRMSGMGNSARGG